MEQTLNRMRDWLLDEEKEKDIKGNLNRMKKILHAFHKHPEGVHARLLAVKIENSTVKPETYSDLAQYIEEWVSVAKHADQRESQSDRILDAKKNGRSETIPYESGDSEIA